MVCTLWNSSAQHDQHCFGSPSHFRKWGLPSKAFGEDFPILDCFGSIQGKWWLLANFLRDHSPVLNQNSKLPIGFTSSNHCSLAEPLSRELFWRWVFDQVLRVPKVSKKVPVIPVPLLLSSGLNTYLLTVASKDIKENVLLGGKQGYKGECFIRR